MLSAISRYLLMYNDPSRMFLGLSEFNFTTASDTSFSLNPNILSAQSYKDLFQLSPGFYKIQLSLFFIA